MTDTENLRDTFNLISVYYRCTGCTMLYARADDFALDRDDLSCTPPGGERKSELILNKTLLDIDVGLDNITVSVTHVHS